MEAYSELYYYDINGNLIKLNECIICKQFLFDRQNFILLLKNNRYYICLECDLKEKKKKGVLISFWGINKNDLSHSEVLSTFRTEYKKNKVTIELIMNFIDNPNNFIKIGKKNGKKKKIS